jgi:UDP-glucuronate 4-epimerase
MADKPIQPYNYGNHRRDYTYIDDIVEGIIRVLDKPAQGNESWEGDNPDSGTSHAPWRIYNIGSNNPIELKTYVSELEKALGKTAEKERLPLQPGDVPDTYANVDALKRDFDYKPAIKIEQGTVKFAKWYKHYYA